MRFGQPIAWICVLLGLLVCADMPLGARVLGQDSKERKVPDSRPLCFAYDPEKEEGPHPDADFEWWYHFGFLKQKGAPKCRYSFVSSFQRNSNGRYLFYTLSDLNTGKNLHYALVDRSLFGVTGRPASPPAQGDGAKPAREPPGPGKRFAHWLQDTLPLLPEGHKFMISPGPPAEPPKSKLWLDYEDQSFHKEGSTYRAVYKSPDFFLDLTLQREGPALPVLGTGLTGLNNPEDQHYYTYPRVSALGLLRKGKEEVTVEGTFWYDHQWGKVVSKVPMKWCWWGLRLKDGRNLSLFFLQDSRSGDTVQKGLTVHHPDGTTDVYKDVVFTPGRSWKSPHGRQYTLEWTIQSQEINMTIHIRPQADNHELPVLLYGWIWEGPCRAEVSVPGGQIIKGIGFQEMIGQANEE